MELSKIRSIIDEGGGPEYVKMFTIVTGGTVLYSDTPFNPDDLTDDGTLYVHAADTFGNKYFTAFDVAEIISVTMMKDVKAERGDVYGIRG